MDRVKNLVWAIHPARSKLKFMLGLSAYFDESGHSEDENCRFVGVGGLCAPASAWTEFDGKWQAVLDEHCGGQPFHMKDFANGWSVYKGWGKAKRETFFGGLVKAIRESGARPFGAVVSLDAYEFVCQGIPAVRRAVLDPYYICFQDVTHAAAVSLIGYSIEHTDDWQEFEEREKVAMVYAYQKRFGAISSPAGTQRQSMGRAESLWHTIKDSS